MFPLFERWIKTSEKHECVCAASTILSRYYRRATSVVDRRRIKFLGTVNYLDLDDKSVYFCPRAYNMVHVETQALAIQPKTTFEHAIGRFRDRTLALASGRLIKDVAQPLEVVAWWIIIRTNTDEVVRERDSDREGEGGGGGRCGAGEEQRQGVARVSPTKLGAGDTRA